MEEKKVNVAIKAYGAKGALSFEADSGKSGDARVSCQGAPSTGPLQYDWKKKIVVQLTDAECMKVYAVFSGLLPKFEAGQHGAENDKTFAVELQASGKFFAKVMQKNKGVFAVPIDWDIASRIAGLCLRQMQLNQPWLTCADIRNSIRDSYRASASAVQSAPSRS